jgi:hypothetical protein
MAEPQLQQLEVAASRCLARLLQLRLESVLPGDALARRVEALAPAIEADLAGAAAATGRLALLLDSADLEGPPAGAAGGGGARAAAAAAAAARGQHRAQLAELRGRHARLAAAYRAFQLRMQRAAAAHAAAAAAVAAAAAEADGGAAEQPRAARPRGGGDAAAEAGLGEHAAPPVAGAPPAARRRPPPPPSAGQRPAAAAAASAAAATAASLRRTRAAMAEELSRIAAVSGALTGDGDALARAGAQHALYADGAGEAAARTRAYAQRQAADRRAMLAALALLAVSAAVLVARRVLWAFAGVRLQLLPWPR